MYLALQNVTKRFGDVFAVDGVGLEIEQAEFVCFLGPSGCGKTTLLRVIAGLEFPDTGKVVHEDKDLLAIPARLRNFGMVFQSYSLFPNMSVGQNVAYGLACRRWPAENIRARVEEMLNLVQLRRHIDKLPSQLSGGEQQRVALARALAPNPHMLLLDEPLSALDAKVRAELRSEIRALQKELGITTIMVTHDQDEAMEMADRIVVMNEGRIVQIGGPVELYNTPANRFVAEFVGRMNILPVESGPDGRPLLAGVPLTVAGSAPRGGGFIGVRPEAPEVIERGAETVNCFEATILSTMFMGNLTIVEIRMGEHVLTIDRRGHSSLLGKIGQSITLHIPPAKFTILAES